MSRAGIGESTGSPDPLRTARRGTFAGLWSVKSRQLKLFSRPPRSTALVADYVAGVGVGELADRYGIHRTTVAAHLRRGGAPRSVVGLDVNEQAEAVRLYRAGLSLRAIGRQLGVDRKTVRAAIAEANVASTEEPRAET